MRPQDHELELEPGPYPHEDACPVCDKIECECIPEIPELTPAETASRDFKSGSYPDQWRDIEKVYHDFSDYQIQCYLDMIKLEQRMQVFFRK